jgi:hypothetical protein
MTEQVKLAFNTQVIRLAIDNILPLKKIEPSLKKTIKYRQIASSIKEIGVVEHLVVHAEPNLPGKYMLLDGHIRLEVLKDIGQKDTDCIIASDDEAFTYNHKVNRLSAIQEHFMIIKAMEKGVSDVRIATTLDLNVVNIRQKRNLLKNVAPEAVELLKEKHISPNAIRVLRRMNPIRQIEVAELMIAAHNYTVPYAKALLAATPKDQVVEQYREKKIEGLSPEEMAKMEKETETLSRDIKLVSDSYGKDTLNLVLACGYLSRLLDNARIVRYLSKHHPDMLSEFQNIIEATSLSQKKLKKKLDEMPKLAV